MVPELKLSGLAKMLAQHSEVKHVASNEIEFCVPGDAKAPAGQRLPGQGAGRAEELTWESQCG